MKRGLFFYVSMCKLTDDVVIMNSGITQSFSFQDTKQTFVYV